MSSEFIYAVSRIRFREQSLLTKSDIDALLACHDYESCIRMLLDKGWGATGEAENTDILSAEREKLWALIDELAPDAPELNIFRYQVDFQNLKAAVKSSITDASTDGMLLSHGTVSADQIKESVKNRETDELPEHLKECAEQAFKTLLETGNGQLCDVIIDKACLEYLSLEAKKHSDSAIRLYSDIFTACAAVKIAARCNLTGKTRDFMLKALPNINILVKEELVTAAENSLEEIYSYISTTVLEDSVDALKASLSSFEKWCDNYIIEKLKEQKYEHMKIGPIVAYIVARENEIKAVRLILSGKLNNIENAIIEERLRDMYV